MKKLSKYFKIIIGIILIIELSPAQAQKISGIKFKSPKTLTEIPDSLTTEDAVIINKKITINYIFSDYSFFKTKAVYYRIKLLTQKGVDEYSNFVVRKYPHQKVNALDARTIKPNKKTVELNKKDINTEDFKIDKYQSFQLLKVAIPGVSVGDEIEYAYSLESGIYIIREEIYFHDDAPALESNIAIYFNNKLEPIVNAFNGTPKPSSKTYDYETSMIFTMYNLDGIKNQDYAIKSNQLPFLAISPRISDPKLRSRAGVGFQEQPVKKLKNYISKTYTINNPLMEQESRKAILEHPAIQNPTNKFLKLVSIHDYINKHFILTSLDQNEKEQIPAYYLEKKKANYTNLVILYTQIFEALDIEYNFVLSRNRYDGPIDEKMININQFEDPFFRYKNARNRWSYLFPKDYSNFYEINELPVKFYGASAMALENGSNPNLKYFTFGYSQRVSNFENRKIKLNVDSENDSLNLDINHTFGGAEYTKHKKEYLMAMESSTLASIFGEELIEWMNTDKKEINWVRELDKGESQDISLDSLSNTYMKMNYTVSARANITQLDSNLFSLPLAGLISHYQQHSSAYKRILDYYPQNEFVSKINYYLYFDGPVTLVNAPDCKINFDTSNCKYQLITAQINDSVLYIQSEYAIKSKYIIAGDYNELRELNSSCEEAGNLNLVYIRKPD